MYQKKYPEITSKIEFDFCKVNYQLKKICWLQDGAVRKEFLFIA